MSAPTCVYVTGCKGYVGSVMCARLTELGYDVIGFDNESRGLNHGVENLPHLNYYKRDCSLGLLDIYRTHPPACVMHFAAATGDLTRPQEELDEINFGMTRTLFQETEILPVKPIFVFPMTSLGLTIPESGYVQSKQKAIEWLLENDPSQRALLFRFFNNAGGYRDFGEFRKLEVHMFPRLFDCWKRGKTFVVNGSDYPETVDGSPARDYIHILDTVDYIIYCWGLKRGGRISEIPTFEGLIECARGLPYTTLKLARLFQIRAQELRIPGKPFDIEIGGRRAFDCGTLISRGDKALRIWREPMDTVPLIDSVLTSFDRFCSRREQPLDMKD